MTLRSKFIEVRPLHSETIYLDEKRPLRRFFSYHTDGGAMRTTASDSLLERETDRSEAEARRGIAAAYQVLYDAAMRERERKAQEAQENKK